MSNSKKLLYIVRDSRYFLAHRLLLALEAKKNGFDINVVVDFYDKESVQEIKNQGFSLFYAPFLSHNPLKFCLAFLLLFRVFGKVRPHLVHAITIKCVILGGMAARLKKIPMIALIPGRGTAFHTPGIFGKFIRKIAVFLYSLSTKRQENLIVFENQFDRNYFIENKIALMENSIVIPGSGVDIHKFSFAPYDTNKETRRILLASRLLKDKGVIEFCLAAKIVKQSFPNVEFLLAGSPDPSNPTSLTPEEIQGLLQDSPVTFLGFQKDMLQLLKSIDIFCLPSYHEGLPISVLEAGSCGRVVIATDIPGCQAVIKHQEDGLLVPLKNSEILAEALIFCLKNPDKCSEFGNKIRKKIENSFSSEIVNAIYLRYYCFSPVFS